MVSIGALKRTLAGKTVHQNVSIDTSFGFDPPQFSLDSTFKFTIMDLEQTPCRIVETWVQKRMGENKEK
jgi:hypothetical protein